MDNADYYLKLDGIHGESTADGHQQEIELTSFNWGITGHYDAYDTTAARGRASVQNLHCTAVSSVASPQLASALVMNQKIDTAVLTVRQAAQDQAEHYVVTLSDVRVVKYQSLGRGNAGASLNSAVPADEFSLSFSKIEFTYSPLNPDGTLGSPVMFMNDWAAGHNDGQE